MFEDRIITLEKQFADLHKRCMFLEKENVSLQTRIEEMSSKKVSTDVVEIESMNKGFEPISKIKDQEIKCEKCVKTFVTDEELKEHVNIQHGSLKSRSKLYICQDCNFQANKSIDLKKHTRATMHKPYESSEVCFTCNQEFGSYLLLMNHRKSDHPSNKICRYYVKGDCIFDSTTCWYRHIDSSDVLTSQTFKCVKCVNTFNNKVELESHTKDAHAMSSENGLDKSEKENCNEDQNMDFPTPVEMKPPDISQVVEILQNLVLQVKNMQIAQSK